MARHICLRQLNYYGTRNGEDGGKDTIRVVSVFFRRVGVFTRCGKREETHNSKVVFQNLLLSRKRTEGGEMGILREVNGSRLSENNSTRDTVTIRGFYDKVCI